MEPLYQPAGVEERWQRTWEEEGHYNADPDSSRKSFAIAHPPPNVTGDWSLGRVSAVAREDGLLKAAANPRGMQGYAVGR